MTPRTSLLTPSPSVAGLLLLALAFFALTIAMILPTQQATAADPDGEVGVQRTLGVGGTFTNHTLINLTKEPVKGFAFKFLTVKPGDIPDDYTDRAWSGFSKGLLDPLNPNPNPNTARLYWWSKAITEPLIPDNGKGHFGYVLHSGVSTGSQDIIGEWTGDSDTVYSVPASSVHVYKTPAVATITPSATLTPTQTFADAPQPTPMFSLALLQQPGQRPAPRHVAADVDPPWVDFEITNTWEDPELPDPRRRTIIVHRHVNVVEPPARLELRNLIEGDPLIESARPIDLRPVEIEYGKSVELRIGPLAETDTGVIVYYSAQPATPPSNREPSVSYWAYTGLQLVPNSTAIAILTLTPLPTLSPTPTPTPTRLSCYFPVVLRNHTPITAVSTPSTP